MSRFESDPTPGLSPEFRRIVFAIILLVLIVLAILLTL